MIHFHTLRWKNILSTGNSFTELKLDKSTNTLVVGHNGAGKSTTIYILAGLIVADQGQIKLFGEVVKSNNVDWRHNVGYVGEAGGYYENWTVEKNLKVKNGLVILKVNYKALKPVRFFHMNHTHYYLPAPIINWMPC